MYATESSAVAVVKCTEFARIAFGVVWFGTALWLRLQRRWTARNYLLHYAGRCENMEKGVYYYYCYSTNKFDSLAAHYKEYRSQSELATFRKRLEIIYPRSSHCMFVSNWISNCSQSSQRWLNSTIHTHTLDVCRLQNQFTSSHLLLLFCRQFISVHYKYHFTWSWFSLTSMLWVWMYACLAICVIIRR